MTAVKVAVLGLILAGAVCEALNKDYRAHLSNESKETAQTNEPPKRKRACLLADGPKNKKECDEFENRWVNDTTDDSENLISDTESKEFRNMSKKDIVVTIGCYAMYTFSQQMWDTCLDANLLTDLLLCQYDYSDDKSHLLKQFHNVKERQDLIDFMEDLKKCTGTAEEDPTTKELGGPKLPNIAIMEIFVRPMKKMRTLIEKNFSDSQE